MGRGDPWTHYKMEETMEAPSWLPFMHFYGVSRGHRAPFYREGPLAWEGPNNSKRHPATDTKGAPWPSGPYRGAS